MGLFGLFGPKWKIKNEKKALKAVEKISDEMTLLRVVFEAPAKCVCLNALHRLSDEKLKAVALGVKYAEKVYGVKFMTEGSWSSEHGVRDLAFENIKTIEMLYEIARMQHGSCEKAHMRDWARRREWDLKEEERKQQAEAEREERKRQEEERKRQEKAERIIEKNRRNAELRNSSSVRLLRECCGDDLEAALNGVRKLLDAGDYSALSAAAGIVEWPYPKAVLKKNINKEVSIFAEICLKEPRALNNLVWPRDDCGIQLRRHIVGLLSEHPDMVQKKYLNDSAKLWLVKYAPFVYTDEELLRDSTDEMKRWLPFSRPRLFVSLPERDEATEKSLEEIAWHIKQLDMSVPRYAEHLRELLNVYTSPIAGYYLLQIICIQKLGQAPSDSTEAIIPYMYIDSTQDWAIKYVASKNHPFAGEAGQALCRIADHLIDRLKKEGLNYSVVDAIKSLYANGTNPGLRSYLREKGLESYERGHRDSGNRHCESHEDHDEISFDLW